MAGVQLPAEAGKEIFCLPYHIQTSSGAHLASHPMGTRGSFPSG